MRLVFFGTSSFSVPALERLQRHVQLVVTRPDSPSGRGLRQKCSDVKVAAIALGLQVETPSRSRDKEFIERVRAVEPDALVVASYGQILSRELLDVPRCASVNLHASLLPKYRGAAPIQWAILNGESETGVTVMMMDEGMDTGDMVAKSRTPIGPDETAGDLHDRLAVLAADLAEEWIARIVEGDFQRTPQDSGAASLAPKISRADAELRFERPVQGELDRYRAFTPIPGAWILTKNGTVKLRLAHLGGRTSSHAAPGTVVSTSPLEVAFADASMVFDTIQLEGREPVTGSDFANGARIAVGDCLKP